MGIFGFGTSKGGHFQFADGSTHKPDAYGYLAVRLSAEGAFGDVDHIFGQTSPAAKLGLVQGLRNKNIATALYMMTLMAAVYLWYADEMLKVNESTTELICVGIKDCLADLRTPGGEPLDADLKETLFNLTRLFAMDIQNQIEAANERDPNAYESVPSAPVERLINLLVMAAGANEVEAVNWKSELSSAPGIWLAHAIEDTTLANIVALRDELRVRYVS